MRSRVLTGAVFAWALFSAGAVSGDDGAARRAPVQIAEAPDLSDISPADVLNALIPDVEEQPGETEARPLGPTPPLSERPDWWWTDPLCRPNWRKLGNCRLDRRGSGNRPTGRPLRDPR